MSVYVNNMQDQVPVDEELITLTQRAASETLALEELKSEAEISVVFVNDDYIQQLNRQYRNIDCPTDVLSFAMQEGESVAGEEDELVLGDVIISLNTAKKQSIEYGHSFKHEVAFLVIHGVLHLLGYDHQTLDQEKVMQKKESAIMKNLGLFI